MNYEEAVKAAATALQRGEDANWQLAQLTYENTRDAGDVKTQVGKVSLEKWAEDVRGKSGRTRWGASTARKYRALWATYGSHKSDDRPLWTAAWYEEVPRDAPEQMRSRQTDIHLTEAGPERKAEIFQRLARDPQVMATPAARETVIDTAAKSPALTSQVISRAQEVRPAMSTSELWTADQERKARAGDLLYDLGVGAGINVRAARQVADRVSRIVTYVRNAGDLPESTREALKEDVADLRAAAEMYRRYAAEIELAMGGDASDTWLRSVLNEV